MGRLSAHRCTWGMYLDGKGLDSHLKSFENASQLLPAATVLRSSVMGKALADSAAFACVYFFVLLVLTIHACQATLTDWAAAQKNGISRLPRILRGILSGLQGYLWLGCGHPPFQAPSHNTKIYSGSTARYFRCLNLCCKTAFSDAML